MEMKEFLQATLGGILLLVAIGLVIGGLITGCNYIDYRLDQSMCKAYVNNELVYDGRCHFMSISSVGENGNTKHLTIYGDVLGFRPLKHYYADNIEVKN